MLPSSDPVLVDDDFNFELALQDGFNNEVLDATEDLGPIGEWEDEETRRQYDLLYGTMDSPLSSAASSPSPSRSASPLRSRAPRWLEVEDLVTGNGPRPANEKELEETRRRQYDLLFGTMESPLSSAPNSPLPSRSPSPSRPGTSPWLRPTDPGLPKKRGRGESPPTEPCAPAPPALKKSGIKQRSHKKQRPRVPSNEPPATAPPVPAPAERPADNSKRRRDKKKAHQSRMARRARAAEAATEGRMTAGAFASRHAGAGEKLQTKFATQGIPSTSAGFTAKPDSKGRVYGLEELLGLGLKLVTWDGRTPRPIVDSEGRVVAVLAGAPRDDGWKEVHQSAFDLLRASAERCRFSKKAMNHRRGLFAVLNVGISFGGGQTRANQEVARQAPGNLCHPAFRLQEIQQILSSPAFNRIAGFASGAFAAWMPRLHALYKEKFTSLLTHPNHTHLKRNFRKSVWAAAAFNYGPRTISNRHRDFANLPFGVCSITALGSYNHTAGGHLVLWELGLVIEFPPGATILLPSAAVAHSNTPIADHELRGSFAQYTAGGLFRWVEHGFQKDASFFKGFTKADKEAVRVENAARGKLGLSLFSKYEELCK